MTNSSVWIDGPMHPDLFDGETPIREEIGLEESGLRVFKVECTYYAPEEETFFIVANEAKYAEDLAWEKIHIEGTSMDSAEVTEMNLDDQCSPWTPAGKIIHNDYPTAREMLVKHIEENGCMLTLN